MDLSTAGSLRPRTSGERTPNHKALKDALLPADLFSLPAAPSVAAIPKNGGRKLLEFPWRIIPFLHKTPSFPKPLFSVSVGGKKRLALVVSLKAIALKDTTKNPYYHFKEQFKDYNQKLKIGKYKGAVASATAHVFRLEEKEAPSSFLEIPWV